MPDESHTNPAEKEPSATLFSNLRKMGVDRYLRGETSWHEVCRVLSREAPGPVY